MEGSAEAEVGEVGGGPEGDGEREGVGVGDALEEEQRLVPLVGSGVGAKDGVGEVGVWVGNFVEQLAGGGGGGEVAVGGGEFCGEETVGGGEQTGLEEDGVELG